MQRESEAVKNMLASYSDNIKKTFPWFNDQEPLAHYEPIEADLVQMYGDHLYAAKSKDSKTNDSEVSNAILLHTTSKLI